MISCREDCTKRGLHETKITQKEYYMKRRQKEREGENYTNGDKTHGDGTYREATTWKEKKI